MPNPITPNEEQLDWLVAAVERGDTYRSMASHMGCCVDTLKRILHRHAIVEFDGAKYQIKPSYEMWTRPCMRCQCTAPRPKALYFCDICRPEESSLPDEWNY